MAFAPDLLITEELKALPPRWANPWAAHSVSGAPNCLAGSVC